MLHTRLAANLCLVFLLAALAFPFFASAQEKEGTLQLEVLIQELVKQNPDIGAAGLKYQAALTRPSQEGALPDPRVSFGWMSAGTILPGGGLGEDPNANINLQIAQEFPYPGKRGLRADTARKDAENQRQMLSATLRNRVAALKTAYYELLFIYQALDLLQENQATLRDLSKVAEARYTVGRAMQQDLIRSETQVAILQNEILVREQRKRSIAAEINTLLNRPADTPLGRPESLSMPDLDQYEVILQDARQNSPMLLAQQAMIESREAGLKLAKKEYYPDFEVMTGYFYQGGLEDMWEVRAGITLPIFRGSKQARRDEEASLQLSEARVSYRSTQQMLEFRLRDAFVKAETSRRLMDLYSRQIVPQSTFALESSLASYETGGIDFLSVLSNFTTILDYKMKIYEQQAEYLKAFALLEELAGRGQEGQL